MTPSLPDGAVFVVLRRAGVVEGLRGSRPDHWVMHCVINPGAHKHGDAHPSGWADGGRNTVGHPTCGTYSAKAIAEVLGVRWSEVLDEVLGSRAPAPKTPRPATATSTTRTFRRPPKYELLALWDATRPVRFTDRVLTRLAERERDALLDANRSAAFLGLSSTAAFKMRRRRDASLDGLAVGAGRFRRWRRADLEIWLRDKGHRRGATMRALDGGRKGEK